MHTDPSTICVIPYQRTTQEHIIEAVLNHASWRSARRRRAPAQAFDFVLEIAGHIVGAMIVTQLQSTRHPGRDGSVGRSVIDMLSLNRPTAKRDEILQALDLIFGFLFATLWEALIGPSAALGNQSRQ